MTEERKLALLKAMARRSAIRRSDPIPLTALDPETGDQVDVSDGGKYFVVLEDPGAEVKDQIFGASRTEEVVTSVERKGKELSSTETAKRTFRIWPTLEIAVRCGVVVDACLPVVNEGDAGIQGWKWRDDAEANLKFLSDRRTPYLLVSWLAAEILRFLQESEEVVEDAGEAPTP